MDTLATISEIVLKIVSILVMVFMPPFIFQLVWNWLVPLLFHGPVLLYWEAFGILMVLGLLCGAVKLRIRV